jgi:thiamine kinase
MPRAALDEIAERWVPGVGPVDIQASSGLVNLTSRVCRAGKHYSLRVAAPDSQALGLDRAWECRVLSRAAAAGLAPRVERCDPAAGILVTDWVDGRAWSAEEILHAGNVKAMAELLRRVHGLPIPRPARIMSAGGWIAHYSAAAAQQGIPWSSRCTGLRGAADAQLALLAGLRLPPPVLCHSDVHRFNLVIADRTLLLDWEYAHVSDAFWDLACWVVNNDWSADDAVRLLTAYLGRPGERTELTRLHTLVWLYDYVCLLWSELYSNHRAGPESADIAVRAARIVERLSAASGSRAG